MVYEENNPPIIKSRSKIGNKIQATPSYTVIYCNTLSIPLEILLTKRLLLNDNQPNLGGG